MMVKAITVILMFFALCMSNQVLADENGKLQYLQSIEKTSLANETDIQHSEQLASSGCSYQGRVICCNGAQSPSCVCNQAQDNEPA